MIAVTASTGHLGRLVIAGLLQKRGAHDIVALARSPGKAADLAALGVEVRAADYSQPATLGPALAGVKTLLVISGSEVGQRTAQHRALVDAVRNSGVRRLAYTSILKGPSSPLALAAEHVATEAMILEAGVPHTFLRNGWYFENYTESWGPALANGSFIGCAGQGRISAASRADFARAAVHVLTSEGHEGKAYELAGDTSFTMSELAAEVSRQTGRAIGYADLPPAEHEAILVGAGVPLGFAQILVDADRNIARGALEDNSRALSRLGGQPTTSLAAAVAEGLKRGA
jgi:NAD(P)H dehydrogenase (quinone)